MAKIKMSSWTYAPVGSISAGQAAKDLKDLGLTCPMSLHYDSRKQDKKEFLAFLDSCYEKGMSVLIDDARADYLNLKAKGEDAYRQEVQAMVADFGSHPAAYGFHVGDEPVFKDFDYAIRAIQICNEYAPNLTQFMNLLPYWANDEEGFFESTGARTPDEYSKIVSDFIRRSGIKLISYDCYAQCCHFDKEFYRGVYFENLRLFKKAADENGVELFTSLLSVGHMSTRVPTEDDIRWQISTAVASGVTGILWFYIYERFLDLSFRTAPVNMYGERTRVFEYLSYQNRIFMQHYAKEFEEDEFVWTKHFGKTYGGFEEFTSNEDILSLKVTVNDSPMQITKLKRATGKIVYIFVNLNQEEPIYFEMRCGERYNYFKPHYWLGPGEMMKLVAKKDN